MPRRMFLVRHAAPELSSAAPPSEWCLSASGRAAAAALRSRLPGNATFASSDERKAIETLGAATDAAFAVDPRFGEVRRPVEPTSQDFRAVRRAWVAGAVDARHAGWESPKEAATRFEAGLSSLRGETVVVATHGMVLTAWLASIGRLDPGVAAADFWQQLRLPDVVEILRR